MTRTVLLLSLLVLSTAEARKATLADMALAKLGDAVEEALIAPPKDGEVCFSPDENCDIKLWKFIQTAKTSLDVAIFDLTHPKITHEILVASKRVKVRVLVDKRQMKGEHSLVSTLIKGGVAVRIGRQRGIMHNKFTVVDGTRLETGSFNYSDGATRKNQENQIYLADPSIVARYKERFEKMWEEAKTPNTEGVAKP